MIKWYFSLVIVKLDEETGTTEPQAERVLNFHEERSALEPCIVNLDQETGTTEPQTGRVLDAHEEGSALGPCIVNFDEETVTIEPQAERILNAQEEGSALEPCIGMEFESEEAAKKFYDEYSRRVGFIVRIGTCRRSVVDKSIISRQLSCNKQGFSAKTADKVGHVRKHRPRAKSREGCKAMIRVKATKSGKWVVTSFEKDHTHPLIVPDRRPIDSVDRRIEDLTMELKHQDHLCELYRGLLLTFLKDIDEQTETLSTKIGLVVNNIREVESGLKKPPQKR
uniref:FAR1 domain-containing protein n=1 Tax=Cannabis sativa TaxID=3483 RepID=A0A803PFR8_CANSA